jgi:pyridinium-3,5-bisthiocarboxylic acid mononucleotide nickel chelatase
MKIAYLDCFSGISGDMMIGALIDAGFPIEELKRALQSLPLEGYFLEATREERNHLFGTRFKVNVSRNPHPHRRFSDIKDLIRAGNFRPSVRDKSIAIFESIAVEEGKIHGCPAEDVHFHEVGAVDSIVDIVGSVLGMDYLGIATVCASSLPLGSGFVDTAHGRIPLPAPATVALLKGIPVHDSGLKEELVTPTGAALVRGLAHSFASLPAMVIEKVGYGVGSRNLADRPNLLRILIGQDQGAANEETVVILESNLDDTNPEWLGFIMERLFEAGALDVVFLPGHMKKNRPAVLVHVIGKPQHKDQLTGILFSESTTLGVRFHYTQRRILERSSAEIESPWGRMKVKKVFRSDGSFQLLPEFEECRRIAKEKGIPLRDIYGWVAGQGRSA